MSENIGGQESGVNGQKSEVRDQKSEKTSAQAKWRQVSGITLANEKSMSLKERRASLNLLYCETDRLIREELTAAAEDVEFKNFRTFLWEPVGAVCFRLEIGPTVLSRLLRECSGISTSQLVDKIKAEGMKEKIRAWLRKHVSTHWQKPGVYRGAKDNFGEQLNDFWSDLKERRQWKSFSYATWAIEFGFANYTRFYRACLLCYGKTPTQLENEVLREYADFFQLARDLARREAALKNPLEERLAANRAPYTDKWAKAMKERPEFILRMREELGIAEEVLGFAGD